MGQVVINTVNSAPAMQLGGTQSNIGIDFSASATAPPGSSNSFMWLQLINSDPTQYTPANGNPVQNCVPVTQPVPSTFPGLDTRNPYDRGVSTNDNPWTQLDSTTYKEISRTFSATMYLLWSPGLANSTYIPLGYVTWQFYGDAKFTSNQWSVNSSSKGNGGFQSSSSYPTWHSFVPYTNPPTCN